MTDLLWLVLRAASLVLTFQAAGAALFLFAFEHLLVASGPAIRAVALRAAVAALGVLLAQVVIEPAHLGGELAAMTDMSLVRFVLASSAGTAFAMRIAGISLVGLGLLWKGRQLLALAGVLLTVNSFLLTGHTTLAPHRLILGALLFLHLGVVAFWFGALWPLRQAVHLEAPPAASELFAAFSRGAVWLVPLIPIAGVAMAVALLPNLAALWTPYGLLLIAKALLFAVLFGIACLNRFVLTPALSGGATEVVPRLTFSLGLEFAIICATLVITALMTGLFSPAEGASAAVTSSIVRARA